MPNDWDISFALTFLFAFIASKIITELFTEPGISSFGGLLKVMVKNVSYLISGKANPTASMEPFILWIPVPTCCKKVNLTRIEISS